jgi:hypothetical protein
LPTTQGKGPPGVYLQARQVHQLLGTVPCRSGVTVATYDGCPPSGRVAIVRGLSVALPERKSAGAVLLRRSDRDQIPNDGLPRLWGKRRDMAQEE